MNGNQSDQLLAALKDDIEWPAASLRLIQNHLEPLQEVCSDDPELLGVFSHQVIQRSAAG